MDNKDKKLDVNIDLDIEDVSDVKQSTSIPKSNELKGGNINTTNIPNHGNINNYHATRPVSPYNKNGNSIRNNSLNSKDNGINNQQRPINHNTKENKPGLNNEDTSNNGQNLQNIPQDNRNLRQKAQDTAQNIKDTADRIKNAPQNIKDKINDTKDKVNNAKDKVKNAPENIRNKAEQAKQKWDNRPKNFNELKKRTNDAAKNAGNNLKERAKQGAKNIGKKAIENGKEEVKEAAENSNIGQAVKKTKEVVEKTKHTVKVTKKAFKAIITFLKATFPWLEIILAILIAIFAIIMLVNYLFPGLFGDVKKDTEYENYANVDQKTLEKLKEKFDGHDINNAALGMATVVYPYFSQLFDGNVTSYLSTSDNEDDDEEDPTIDTEGSGIDNEDIEKEDDDQVADDMYLFPFRNSKVRNRLNKVLEHLDQGEDKWEEYLKNTYFKGDKGYKKGYDEKVITGYNGYKKLFKAQIDSSYEDNLEDAIIKNLQDIKDMFLPYIFDSVKCTSSTVSLGTGTITTDTTGRISSNMVIHVTEGGSDIAVLSMEDYVIGVTLHEIGFNYKESTQAQMIAAQSFVIAITYPGGTGSGRGTKYDVKEDGSIHYYVPNSTNYQTWCDPKNCTDRSPRVTSDEKLAEVRQWYKEIERYYIYNEAGGYIYSAYVNETYNQYCPAGDCMLHQEALKLAKTGYTYEQILLDYSFTKGYVLYDSEIEGLASVTTECHGITGAGGCSISEEDFIYYSQRNYNDAFCGRSDGTINSSGCGVTSMAMVLANLADPSITPVNTMNEAASASSPGPYCGAGIVGTNSGYFSYSANLHGLTYSSVSADGSDAEEKVKNTLNSGGLIIANVGAGWSTVTDGHYLVIRGITAEGNLLIADPMNSSPKDLSGNWKDNVSFSDMITYMSGRKFHLFTGGKSDDIKEKYCTAPATGNPGEVTGYLGNPIDPSRTDVDYNALEIGNSKCYPTYCNGGIHAGVDLGFGALKSKLGITSLPNIYAMDGGTVSAVFDTNYNCSPCSGNNSFGIAVTIKHGDTGYSTHYAHLSKRIVNVGDTIAKGQQIGIMGNTGNSSGEHLHIELRSPLYDKNGRDNAKGSENKGLMNPTKYINKNVSYIGAGK